jgi:16S rRNA (uracil1498-N3)-methyltransferase
VDHENQSSLMGQTAVGSSYLVLIGPEGDFTRQEIRQSADQNFMPCSLGKNRLRTETAGLVAVHILNLKNSEKTLSS